jgi:crossover junction endodeoxyribonuclease RuvC
MEYRFLGIDPGLSFTGWGVIDYKNMDKFVYVASGVIKTSTKTHYSERLGQIFSQVLEVIKIHTPEKAAIEETYINVNGQSSIKLAQAKAAAMIAMTESKLSIVEFPAKTVKKSITGSGNADKSQVMQMMKYWLQDVSLEVYDESDALAIALCYATHYKHHGKILHAADLY